MEPRTYDNPTEFLESFMSYTHACGKIVVDSRYKIDIFEDCLHFYSDKSGRIRQFPLNRIVLLYAITIYLQHQNEVTYSDFVRRIRIVNNLIQNSEDEVSDRQDRNRIPAILQAIDAIVLTGVIDDSIEINFNVNQIQEEKKKIEFLTQNPDCTDEVFELEDHNMLKGQIGIIGLDNLSLGSRFSSLFACSWDKIDCALMTLGNYGQQERNKWRYQFASKSLQYAWDELFHKSANAGFENTHTILVELLKSKESFDDGILDGIISAFLAQCEKDNLYPWNYYYVKYPVFRPGSYGKMSNDDVVNKPYMFSVMQTKTQWSQNTYMPYLKEADDDHLSRDEMGQYLVYDDVYIVCENNSFVRCAAVIILDIDELVHAQYQGRIGMLNDDTVLMKQNKLAELTKRLLQDGFDVYITADHGNTPCTGLGRLTGSGVEVETRSHKMVVLKDFANKDSLIERYGLLEYPKYYLPKDYDYLICNVGDSLDIKGENVMTHGGISLDEVVVPFIIARTEDYHG